MDSPDSSSPQVAHPAATEALVDATRRLVATQRMADAPLDVLEQAAALVREAIELLAPHQVDGVPGAERAAGGVPRPRAVRHG